MFITYTKIILLKINKPGIDELGNCEFVDSKFTNSDRFHVSRFQVM